MIGYVFYKLAGQTHSFRLTVPGHVELDCTLEGGISGLWDRLTNDTFLLTDIRHVLRVSLVGGGMPPREAERLLTAEFGAGMAKEARYLCRAILAVSILSPDGKSNQSKSRNGDDDYSSTDIYQTAGAIGLRPSDLADMTMWEFNQYLEGWNIAQGGGGDVSAPDKGELAELVQRFG